MLHNFQTEPQGALTYAGAATGAPYDGSSPLYGIDGFGDTIYELKPSGGTWAYDEIYQFCSVNGCPDGGDAEFGLTMDRSGNLFGVTNYGGAHESGVVFELSPNGGSWTEPVLHDFCAQENCADGQSPSSELTIDNAGNLFGLTSWGGTPQNSEDRGLLYELTPNGGTYSYSVVHTFCSARDCKDGAWPRGPLRMDGAGNLFGVTRYGGGNYIDQDHKGGGVVFELSGTQLKPLYAFCARAFCSDGQNPSGGILFDSSGNIFGVTENGGRENGGTVFVLTR